MQSGNGKRERIYSQSRLLFRRAVALAHRGDSVISAMAAVAAVEAMPSDLHGALRSMDAHWASCLRNPLSPLRRPGANFCASEFGHCLTEDESKLLGVFSMNKFDRMPLLDKLKSLHCAIDSGSWSARAEVMESLSLLVEARNAFVHGRSEYLSQELLDGHIGSEILGYPPVVDRLVERRLMPKPDGTFSWLEVIDQSPFALWTVKTAGMAIAQSLNALPDSPWMNRFIELMDPRS